MGTVPIVAGVERPVLEHVLDDGRVDPRVGGVGDDRQGVVLGAAPTPHSLPPLRIRAGMYRRYVAGDVQVGDPLVGVDVGQPRAPRQRGLERRLDLGPVRHRRQSGEDRAEAVVGRQARRASSSPYLSKTSAKYAFTTWPKMIGSETFIIVALRCTENRTSSPSPSPAR